MDSAQHPHWPAGVPRDILVPATSLFYNLEVTATRYPDKPATVFYDSTLGWAALRRQAESLAAHLQRECGVAPGDRVALYMQNCPQFIIAFYAILRADAVTVPVNPMLHAEEVAHIVGDSGARVLITAQELLPRVRGLIEAGTLAHGVVTAYSDALTVNTELKVPEFAAAAHGPHRGLADWRDAVSGNGSPAAHGAVPDTLAVLPYTSGTTGQPKGCMLHHRNLTYAALNGALWSATAPDLVSLTVVPMFHITGLVYGACAPAYTGATSVILPRWDRDTAAELIHRYQITNWINIPTMVIDLLASPRLAEYDLSSLARIGGGGAAMPEAVARRLKEQFGLDYAEGYGLTETTAGSHSNPVARAKRQCLGIPMIGVDSRIIDPETLRELPQGEVGEIVTHGKQVFSGYWNDAAKTRAAFIELGGKRFFRTGDLGYIDDEG
ncbi:MAG: AMP-binding protein, partial [Burkholderiales bacterium]